MSLFPSWTPLREGFPTLREWNDFGKAWANARGTNGINLSLQGGALVISGPTPRTDHPFRVYATATNKVTITPGFVSAQGCTDQVPLWWDTSTDLIGLPREEKTITASAVVLLHVTYDAYEVWQSTEILIESTSFDYTNTYTDGYLLIAAITFADGKITNIVQGVTTSLSHTKCNIYHTWTATGQVPSTLIGYVLPPQLASDPATPTAGYIYFNTTSNVYKYWTGSAWVTM